MKIHPVIFFTFAGLFILGGCARHKDTIGRTVTPSYSPKNYTADNTQLRELSRVVVLPVYFYLGPQDYLPEINRIVFRSITNQNHFACIPALPADMIALFGKESFSTYDILPTDFFAALQKKYDADAVLITELTEYDAYKPITVGLRSSIIRMDGEILWMFDDVFNAGKSSVRYGALRYQENKGQQSYPLVDGYSALQSPSRFTAYAAYTMFSTIKI